MNRRRAVLELVASAVIFGVMAFVAKRATGAHELGGAQAAFLRFSVGVVIIAALVSVRLVRLRPVRYRFLALRGVFGGFAVLLYFLGIAHLPVGTATLLNFTSPVFTATFAAWFLAEKLPRGSLAAMLVAGTGVVLVVYGQGRLLGGALGWQALALISAVFSGAALTSIRAARRTDGAWEIFGAFCLIGALCTAPFAAHDWLAPSGREWLLLGVVGALAVIAQVLMTRALAAVDAATAGIISQLTVVTAFLLGHMVDHDAISLVSAIGSVVTLCGVTLAARPAVASPGVGLEARQKLPM